MSSGIAELDRFLGHLFIGDNVIWYEDTGSFSAVFCLNFVKETLSQKKPLVYVSFDRSPKNVLSFLGPLAESQDLTVLDCFTNGKGDGSEVFNKFYEKDGALYPYKVIRVNDPTSPALVGEAMYGVHRTLNGDVHFILDSLTGMQSLWGGEDQVIDFYGRTCPRLYELDTIAYWLIEKDAHSNRLKANINKIAQVAIELSVRRGKSTLKIVKAEKRNSKFLNEHQEFLCENSDIFFPGQRQERTKFELGSKIKALRTLRGLSQKELAALTGVTPSSISQLEKNLIYPSLPALFRIAESLGVEVATLFKDQGEQQQPFVFGVDQRSPISLGKTARDFAEVEQLLPPELDAPVTVTLIRVHPGGKLGGHFFTHKGKEMGYLISGKLEATIRDRHVQLIPGDVLYLDRDVPGEWHNTTGKSAELLWISFT